MEHALNSGRRDSMAPGDLAEALALATCTMDSFIVQR